MPWFRTRVPKNPARKYTSLLAQGLYEPAPLALSLGRLGEVGPKLVEVGKVLDEVGTAYVSLGLDGWLYLCSPRHPGTVVDGIEVEEVENPPLVSHLESVLEKAKQEQPVKHISGLLRDELFEEAWQALPLKGAEDGDPLTNVHAIFMSPKNFLPFLSECDDFTWHSEYPDLHYGVQGTMWGAAVVVTRDTTYSEIYVVGKDGKVVIINAD